jgi:tetratricopeptide (TPR) repeat protein
VSERYLEGTLQRLLNHPDLRAREAVIVALRLLGTMSSNETLATCLYEEDPRLQELAEQALWAIWFRADSPENSQELQGYVQLITDKEYAKALTGLNSLIQKAPAFAEAFNQRAILFWRWGEYKKSLIDCEHTLRLNPHHFGAQAGMGQCFLQLKKPKEALRAFRAAQKIHPGLQGIEESIYALEQMLKEERGRDERK